MFGNNIFNVPQVKAASIKTKMDDRSVIFLDVRTKEEFSRGGLPGSINIPVDEVVSKVEQVLPNKEVETYVYCLSGSRSTFAVMAMKKMGYQKVFEVESGLLAMRSEGLV